jgi:hypothetical protein
MANKLTSADIKEITTQSDLISKSVRDNYTNLKNKTNEVIDELAAVTIGTTNAETTAARPYHTDLKDRLDSMWVGKQNYLNQGGVISEQGTPNMTVAISAGNAKVNGVDCEWAAQNSATITAPGSNTRLDYVVINSDSTVSVVTGTPAASPDFPSVATTQLVVGCLVVKSSTTSLNDGVEIFNFLNGNNPYFPDLYINVAYTATDKSHNNVIVDLSSDIITGSLVCQGYCHIVEYTNTGSDGSGETSKNSIIPAGPNWVNDTTWSIKNGDTGPGGIIIEDTLDGSVSGSSANTNTTGFRGNLGGDASNLEIKAYSIYIKTLSIAGGNGASGTTERDGSTTASTLPAGKFYIGTSGGDAGDAGDLTLSAVADIEVLSGGTVNLNGGNGGSGASASSGTVGNLGGAGADSGDGGIFTYTCKTYTNNGTVTTSAGTAGTGGVGSGGSDNNGNGSGGTTGSTGSTSATIYDFTTGLVANYAEWVHPLYTGYSI